ncbi:MAG: hypothetical protein OHK003_32030 [Anaerolineales bacterium]
MVKKRMLGKFIAAGRAADIYEWETGCVLKLFHDWMTVEDIEYELQMAQAACSSGLVPFGETDCPI